MKRTIQYMAAATVGITLWNLGIREGVRRVLKAEREFALRQRGNP